MLKVTDAARVPAEIVQYCPDQTMSGRGCVRAGGGFKHGGGYGLYSGQPDRGRRCTP
ncbi:hypothetical protein ICHIJ1_23050 [Fluviibacter phosphoraccumulans]|uniref:Uncharacterized protein n=1 Tax=Fluviibacter phosphoraccumulans TaxID=1751046 RepID=A0A679IDT2_9RHOO|nr:hypothetical protein ICHIAU1_07420 [Fluviibacter phosphoraccumulans]BBU72386.1 hypothetical protein ICHIJ1_23050 [Fluviibacter phosphoraccumulans]BCA66642.1 hypothetical protein SHINM1_022440 [Fluviibacter phosphoraccumulans]